MAPQVPSYTRRVVSHRPSSSGGITADALKNLDDKVSFVKTELEVILSEQYEFSKLIKEFMAEQRLFRKEVKDLGTKVEEFAVRNEMHDEVISDLKTFVIGLANRLHQIEAKIDMVL